MKPPVVILMTWCPAAGRDVVLDFGSWSRP